MTQGIQTTSGAPWTHTSPAGVAVVPLASDEEDCPTRAVDMITLLGRQTLPVGRKRLLMLIDPPEALYVASQQVAAALRFDVVRVAEGTAVDFARGHRPSVIVTDPRSAGPLLADARARRNRTHFIWVSDADLDGRLAGRLYDALSVPSLAPPASPQGCP